MLTAVITSFMFFELALAPVGSFLACTAPHINSLLSWHSLIQEYSPLVLQTLLSIWWEALQIISTMTSPCLHTNKCSL